MSETTNQPESSAPAVAAVKPRPTPKWLKLLGFKFRHGKTLRIGLNWWGWLLLVGTVGMIGMGAFAEYSMQPDFCRSCHIMEPYFQAWHSSTHKNVACPECHFEPGMKNTIYGKFQASSQAVKYVTNTYGSKPHAEIKDASCMREGCHEKRLLEGKVNWDVKSVNGQTVTIRFDHKPHLTEERRGKQLRCVSCHSQIVQGQHLVVTLDTCYLCHFKGLEHGRNEQALGGCKSCHDAPKNEIRLATGNFKHTEYLDRGVTCNNCHSDAIKGDGAVPKQVCWNCHNQPTQIAKYSETRLIHEEHVSNHKVECSSCHIQIEHSLTAGAPKLVLKDGTTHIQTDAGTCKTCHEQTHGGPGELYRGTGGRGVPDMPSPMFRAQVDCIACHKAKKQNDSAAEVVGQTFVAAQESCNYCHGTKYGTSLDEWRKTIAAAIQRAEVAYAGAKASVSRANLPAVDQLRVDRLLDDADHNIKLVKLGHGVHNVNYATAVLNVAVDRCNEVARVITASAAVGVAK